MVTLGRAGVERDRQPVALWIDLHRVRDSTVRCRGHLLGEGDACADVQPEPALLQLLQAGTPEGYDALVAQEWSSATRFGSALGAVLLPEPVKELLKVSLTLHRPVEVRVRAHD